MNKEIRRISNYSSLPVLIFVMSMQLFSAVVSTAYLFATNTLHITIPPELFYLALYVFVYPVGGSIAALIFYKTRRRETGLRLRQTFCKPQMSAGRIFKWIVITWGLAFLTSIFTNLIKSFAESLLHIEISDPDINMGDGAGGFLVSFLALSVFAPIFEEILFRSAVYRHTEIMGQGFAVIFSSLMFALMHGNLDQLPYTFVMGLGLAYIFAKTRSLPVTMLFHFTANTLTVVFTTLIGDASDSAESLIFELQQGNIPVIIVTLLYELIVYGLITAAIIMGIIELVRAIKRKEHMKGGIFPISGAKKAAVFFTAPITLITILLMIFFIGVTTVTQIMI